MSDKLDRITSLNRKINNSEYLYGVKACHFTNLTYKKALEEKIRLAKGKIRYLNGLLDNNEFSTVIPEDEEFSEYQLTDKRINDIWKAIDFNRALLEELKGCK